MEQDFINVCHVVEEVDKRKAPSPVKDIGA